MLFQVHAFNKYGRDIGVVFESENYEECVKYIKDMLEICGEVDLRIFPEI
jgi:hypothetical protein